MALDRVLHGNEPLRTMEEVMAMRINQAEQLIRDLADEITAEVRAKGYDGGVEFWIGTRTTRVTWMFSRVAGSQKCGWGADLSEAASQARAWAADLHDMRAYDAELSAPLFLLSEQPIAQAAE